MFGNTNVLAKQQEKVKKASTKAGDIVDKFKKNIDDLEQACEELRNAEAELTAHLNVVQQEIRDCGTKRTQFAQVATNLKQLIGM